MGLPPPCCNCWPISTMAGMKKLRAEQPVEQHHDGGDEECGEGKQRHDGRGEDAPYRQGHSH